jgi:hypothetical protein
VTPHLDHLVRVVPRREECLHGELPQPLLLSLGQQGGIRALAFIGAISGGRLAVVSHGGEGGEPCTQKARTREEEREQEKKMNMKRIGRSVKKI